MTFHVGLHLRMSYLHDRRIPVEVPDADLLPGTWRRWEQAFETFDSGDEAETFQAVGMRLRECLISFVGETTDDELVPVGEQSPKRADFTAWSELLASALASGESNADPRSYLKKHAVETWEYVNWLTHAKNADRVNAMIAIQAVEHLLQVFSEARYRIRFPGVRCGQCGSYRLIGNACEHCGWIDPDYVEPDISRKNRHEQMKPLNARRCEIAE